MAFAFSYFRPPWVSPSVLAHGPFFERMRAGYVTARHHQPVND